MEPINWYGTYSLTLREVKRFIRVYNQTLITPAISALIFLAVFALAVGAKRHEINGIKFINFMGYGLIIMSIVQNAFGNSSSSLIMSKIIGYISDILTPPLGSKEIIIAFTIGAVLRGLMVGIIVTISLIPFVEFNLYHPLLLAFYILASCTLLGKLGILSGMIANSFDQHSAITSYLITPLSFLSGTFYSVKDLPQILQQINFFNPFFYMIDGFRSGFIGFAETDHQVGLIMITVIDILLVLLAWIMLRVGYKTKF